MKLTQKHVVQQQEQRKLTIMWNHQTFSFAAVAVVVVAVAVSQLRYLHRQRLLFRTMYPIFELDRVQRSFIDQEESLALLYITMLEGLLVMLIYANNHDQEE